MSENDKYFEVNKATWNEKVNVHSKSEMYDLEAFKKGKSSLMQYEVKALGDVKGKSLLHLQCHFGQDTLSWSRLGAKCVGVDISNEGVKLAQQLNEELNLDAEFVCCNVLDTSNYVKDEFDIVFTSYGTIGWLPDLKPWANMIAERLKIGGTFYIADFHPIDKAITPGCRLSWIFHPRLSNQASSATGLSWVGGEWFLPPAPKM